MLDRRPAARDYPPVTDPDALPIDTRGPRSQLRALIRHPPLDPEAARTVIEHLANGRRITAIGATPGLPPYWVIDQWRKRYPEFDEAVVAASEAGAEAMAWETIDIADDEQRPAACREVSIRARQFMMKVLNRKRFDPATRIEVSGNVTDGDDLSDADLARMVRRAQAAQAEDAVAVEIGPRLLRGGRPPFFAGAGGGGPPPATPPTENHLNPVSEDSDDE